ncbi:MerR family transcriptional regulator [Fibrobacterota bacterium]
MSAEKNKKSVRFYTTGQSAKLLRISVSTLKRWLNEEEVLKKVKQNSNGWKLFSEADIEILKKFRRQKKKMGRNFRPSTLKPVE